MLFGISFPQYIKRSGRSIRNRKPKGKKCAEGVRTRYVSKQMLDFTFDKFNEKDTHTQKRKQNVSFLAKNDGFSEACFQRRGLTLTVANTEDFSETPLLSV